MYVVRHPDGHARANLPNLLEQRIFVARSICKTVTQVLSPVTAVPSSIETTRPDPEVR